MIKIDLSSM